MPFMLSALPLRLKQIVGATAGAAAHKGSLKMPKRKARPVTVSAPQKGRSKLKGGIPLDELLAAHGA